MRLKSFQIKNYCSIVDSGVINLSEHDNVTVFAGQNESGKSSILKALRDYERDELDSDSIPFSLDNTPPTPTISCEYKLEQGDKLFDILSETIIGEKQITLEEGEKILDEEKISRIQKFTITKIFTKTSIENNQTKTKNVVKISIDENTSKIFRESILEKPKPEQGTEQENVSPEGNPEEKEENKKAVEKYTEINEEQNSEIASWFWQASPIIVFFDNFCDLLPDKIFISTLRDEKTDSPGYKAVRNLEKILETNFTKKDLEKDEIRRTKENKENNSVSVDFQKDWGQRIHEDNEVVIKYQFEKRVGSGESGSYVNFYIATKEEQPLPLKQRSRGFIWFLSLWLELKAQDINNKSLVLLLDEPDLHLHIKAQKDILKLINKLSGRTDKGEKDSKNIQGNQILCATHSPYLIEVDSLNRIKLVLNTKEEGTKVEDITTSKLNTKYKRDALQPISNALGLSISDFSNLKQNNVILEGLSDFYYFSGMKRLLEKNDDYAFVPGVGIRNIDCLISLFIGYGLSWVAIIDGDKKGGGKDSQKKFDKIKDSVFDRDKDKTKEKVYTLEADGIENMFTHSDLKLIDPSIKKKEDNSNPIDVIGKERKIFFSKIFFEKINNEEITIDEISKTTKDKFNNVFKFIEDSFKESK